MPIEKTKFVIVNYEPKYAKSVADMWNQSRDGWGGHSEVRTEEQILNEESNSTNLKTFLALDGEEVVGYCGFSEYKDDEGALYIPLLNVRSDYHGKKVGKKLVLEAVKETINRDWPRLDLYTWPGNTKAVPLYKKCGFFWEKREDSVHLMNFLPQIINAPLLKSFFQHADWYEDSVREIVTEPDGKKDGDFEFYDYHWKKENRFLKVKVEKTSRGICAVETENYFIEMELDDHGSVYGKSYPVRFRVINHGDNPISLQVNGVNHRNIEFSMTEACEVAHEEVIEGQFYVQSTKSEQNSRKTHPSVCATLVIDGQEIDFKMGVLPKPPVKCQGRVQQKFSVVGREETAFLELENQFRQAAVLRFSMTNTEAVTFTQTSWEVSLKEQEKATIDIPYLLKYASFYHETVNMSVKLADGEVIEFDQEVTFPFNTLGCRLYGECRNYYHLFSGMTHVAVKKEDNSLLYERGRSQKSSFQFFYPKLGKPFSEEFASKKASHVTYVEHDGSLELKLTYESRHYPGVSLDRIIALSGDGLMSQEYIISNNGDLSAPLSLTHSFMFPFIKSYVPYDGDVMYVKGSLNSVVNVWEEKKVSENWFFSEQDGVSTAFIWEKDMSIHFRHWHIQYFEKHWDQIDPKESVSSGKVWFGQQIFANVDDVRAFAGAGKAKEKWIKKEPMSFHVKSGTPIIDNPGGEATLTFKTKHQRDSEVNLSVLINETEVVSKIVKDSTVNWDGWDVKVPIPPGQPITPVAVQGTLSAQHVEKRCLVFQTSKEVKTKEVTVEGQNVYEVDNGFISFKAAPQFYPGLYSLVAGGSEWLHSSFPTPEPKSWWNPWIGGISFVLEKVSQRKMREFPATVSFVKVRDQFEQEWTGIQITVKVNDHELYKGLTYHQFAVTRPGLPVVAVFTGIEQETGHHFYGAMEHCIVNIHPGEASIGNVTAVIGGEESREFTHHDHEVELYDLKDVRFERKASSHSLHFLPSSGETELYMNKDVVLAGADVPAYTKTGEFEIRAPHFIVLSEAAYSLDDYESLRSLRFTVKKEGDS
ncbi:MULTISPECIES: GNAT family N-acetyltransferase [Bacillaceae]|uniref:GNAT family N-acetyltransferase n=1 Tax=Evansella alkalicola TaxID=745819 RepID=A0ABS6JUM0_9BACI|nr:MULTISPECIES: GNAT family N-acetyltransferase [Bacillaceae]MBU9721394.1 GNAT family N-acetyltransferase [Bacillus alkalicola]